MNTQYSTLGAVIKPRTLALLDAIVALPVTGGLVALYSGAKECPNSMVMILSGMLVVSVVLVSWLAFYVYKFKMIEKELLVRDPTFYSDKEISRWFDYYAKKEDAKTP
jgi:ammonia channel protein AmtB